jgi:photosystem II stability/assembly factor-like uncharacterized protein
MKISLASTVLLLGVVALQPHAPAAHAALDQWSTGGPNGVGPINAIAVDPTNPLVLYAGSGTGGAVSKSVDGGASWQPASTGLPASAKSSLAVDPTNPSVVYVGVNVGGVFKSTDGGGTWNPANTGLLVTSVQSVTIDPQNPNIVYASTSGAPPNGVFRSVNGGGNWNVMGTGLPNGIINTLAIDPQTPSTIYAGTQFGVYKTTNSGGNWAPMNTGFNPATPIINAVVINPQNTSRIFAGTGGVGVWKSEDGGGSWSPMTTGISSSAINDLVMDPLRPQVLYAATASAGVFRTRNGGESWTRFGVGLTANAIPSLAISPSGTCVHAGTNVGGASGQVFDFAFVAGCGAMAPPVGPLLAAVLPLSRSVRVNEVATAFVTLINSGASPAVAASIALASPIAASFVFQTTDPSTNLPTGTANVPVDIPAGGFQTFLIAVTPTGTPLAPTEVAFTFEAENTIAATAPLVGVNTLLLSSAATTPPDIVALAETTTHDGITNIPAAIGTGVFAVATVNVGASSAITISADTGGVPLPVNLFVCQTDPGTALCLAPPAPSLNVHINAGDTPTFTVLVQGTGNVPFDPASNRVFFRARDGDVTRGSTGVAIRTVP